MSFELPAVPEGSGQHPVALVVVSANSLAASGAFYSGVFGWQLQPMSAELTAVIPPAGPMIALRANVPVGFPAMIPYIRVPNVAAMLAKTVAAGCEVERKPFTVPMVGTLARFKDAAGTIYGLTDTTPGDGSPRIVMPLGNNPKPPAGAICSLEMYAANGTVTSQFFGELFGWGTLATMPSYMAFDPGGGVGGVFQSHTPSMPALAYIYATDVDAKLVEIESAGGKRTSPPMRLPGAGCFGYFTDPSGTNMGLIGP